MNFKELSLVMFMFWLLYSWSFTCSHFQWTQMNWLGRLLSLFINVCYLYSPWFSISYFILEVSCLMWNYWSANWLVRIKKNLGKTNAQFLNFMKDFANLFIIFCLLRYSLLFYVMMIQNINMIKYSSDRACCWQCILF